MLSKVKAWIKENLPGLSSGVGESKYLGMAYDHFASLSVSQQKNTLFGGLGVILLVLLAFVGSLYLNFWSYAGQAKDADKMVSMLQQYQQERERRSGEIAFLQQNNRLAAKGALSQHLTRQGGSARISPRMMNISENEGPKGPDDEGDITTKHAVVKLERVNLEQLKTFLEGVEHGSYNLSVSSIKIKNDDQLRGYMNVEIGVVAYLFQGRIEG